MPPTKPAFSYTLLGALATTVVLAGVGCSTPATDTTGKDAAPAAPVTKPGTAIGANNPAAGAPNHISPEMQERLKQYQSKANK